MGRGNQLIVLALEMRYELQMPVEHLRTAISLDCRQSLDEITQIACDVLQIVLHGITPCRSGQFSQPRIPVFCRLGQVQVIDLF